MDVQVQCCFTSTETIRTIKDGEPRTAASISTQLLTSGLWTLSFSFFFHGAICPQKPYGFLGTGKNGVGNVEPTDYSSSNVALRPQRS